PRFASSTVVTRIRARRARVAPVVDRERHGTPRLPRRLRRARRDGRGHGRPARPRGVRGAWLRRPRRSRPAPRERRRPRRRERGSLTVMASGPAAAFTAAESALAAMATHVYRLGDAPGIGSTVKMVNQLLAGVHIAAAAEAIALGTRAGADPRVLFEVISKSAGRSWMFENCVPHMLAGDYTPLSALAIFVKDLGIVLEAGQALRFPLPLAAAAHQLYLMGAAAGLGREDDSAVVKVFEKLTGI